MEFLQTPDVTHLARAAADSGSNNPATPTHQTSPSTLNAASNTITGNGNAAIAAGAPVPPASVPWANFMTPSVTRPSGTGKIPEGSRQDIKNSFRSLFSPAPGASPSPFLSGAYPYYPGITPYIAPSHSPIITDTPNVTTEHADSRRKDDGAIDRSTLMSSPHLRRAAKQAAAKEFMNMETFPGVTSAAESTSPGLSTVSVEQTVPSAPENTRSSSGQGIPAEASNKDGNQDEKAEVEKAVEAGATAPMPVPLDKNGVPVPHVFPMYPVGMRGFPAAPPGMHAIHPMGYPYPMLIPAHAAPQMVGGYMQAPPAAPIKKPVKANETPEEKKARIEREKEELIREFKKKTREAALVRFRQKRRERKFGKLIRYNCRKKLADARPRVKGRFVRVKDVQSSKEVQRDDYTQVVPGVQ